MKSEWLFEAIGQLDEQILAQTEEKTMKHKHIIGKSLLIAAVIMGLAITAMAAPVIFNALKGAKVEKDHTSWYTPTNSAGHSYEVRQYEITLDVEMNENAPNTIDVFYLPTVDDAVEQLYGFHNEKGLVQYGWMTRAGYVYFQQIAGGVYDPETNKEYATAVPSDVPKAQLMQYADAQCYLIEEKPVGDFDGMKTVIWSDGDYLYRLEVTFNYTDQQIEKMVAGFKQVDNISDYLMPVTE